MAAHRQARPAAGALNDRSSMDFVSDALFDGRRIRALTVVDDYSRESLAIEVGQSITGEQVVAVMNRIVAARGAPKTIRVDNGPEIRVVRTRSVGLSAPGHARLQPARQADRQRPGRILQWATA